MTDENDEPTVSSDISFLADVLSEVGESLAIELDRIATALEALAQAQKPDQSTKD